MEAKQRKNVITCIPYLYLRSMNSTPFEKPNLNDLAAHNVLPVSTSTVV